MNCRRLTVRRIVIGAVVLIVCGVTAAM